MNFLRLSFTAASHKTFRHMLRNGVSSNVNIMIRGFATAAGNLESEQVVEKMNRRGDFVTYDTLINDMSRAEELSRADRTRQAKRLSPNKTSYNCLIDSFCKHDRFDVAYRVLKEMIGSGFPPSFVTMDNVLHGFLRIGDVRNAYEMRNEMNMNEHAGWIVPDAEDSILQRLSDEVTYTSLVNAYLDEGKWDDADILFEEMERLDECIYHDKITHICSLPKSVLYSVFINGLDNKARTTEIKKRLLRFNYKRCFERPILEFHLTLAENCSDDGFKSLVEIVNRFCDRGLENAYDTMLKSNYKPDGIEDGIVYNLFVIAHCQRHNIDEACNMYKEMVHHGFACHMFTVFALVKTLHRELYLKKEKNSEDMVNEMRWVIQNVLRSCNLNDSEIVNYLDEFNPNWVIQNVLRSCNLNDSEIVNYLDEFNPKGPISDSLFDVLAEKAKDGLFLKCSYAPASA